VKETDKDRYIWYRGMKIPVTQKDYSDTMRPVWKEAKRRKMRIKRELSLDWLKERGGDIPADGPLVHEIIEDKLLLDSLLSALDRLNDKELKLIKALYYQQKTEREIATESGQSKTRVHKEKHKILDKLRKLLS
jgi:RNA polymerase sigma factor (sigma-70 family)